MNPRRALEWTVPTLAVAAAVAASVLWAAELPSPMAIHWGPGGQPDGSGPLWVGTVLVAGVIAAVGHGSLRAASSAPSRWTVRGLTASALAVSGFLAAVHLLALRANAGAPTWEQADPVGPATVLGWPLVAAAVLGLVGWWSSGDRPDPEVTTYRPEEVRVAPGEAVVWSGTATGSLSAVAPLALVAVAAVLWFTGSVAPAAVILLAAAVLAATLRIRATVGPTGLTVRLGPLARPRIRAPLEEIEDVTVEHVEPMAYGGWGYRLVPGTRAIVVRCGEAIRVVRRERPDLVVTLPDARTAAGVLLAHLRAATGGRDR